MPQCLHHIGLTVVVVVVVVVIVVVVVVFVSDAALVVNCSSSSSLGRELGQIHFRDSRHQHVRQSQRHT